jgi:hypothetical protein
VKLCETTNAPVADVELARMRDSISTVAVPVTLAEAVRVNARSTYAAEVETALPPDVVFPEIAVHVAPLSTAVPIVYAVSCVP